MQFLPARILTLALTFVVLASAAWADGNETLGPPSIPIASGAVVAAGTGLVDQPGQIEIVVPAGAAVLQVLLYWDGDMTANVPGDSLVTVNGIPVRGQLIGGPTFFFSDAQLGDAWVSSFRADITPLGLVGPGANTLTIEDVDFTRISNGAGALVIYDDGGDASAEVRDGLDLAFVNFAPPLDGTVAQTFSFPSAGVDRTAQLSMFFSSVSMTGESRPTSIEVTVAGTTAVFSNLLDGNDGEEWDTVNLDVPIPAGAGTATVQAFSRDDEDTGNLPASFAWVAATFSLRSPPVKVEKFTNGHDADDAEGFPTAGPGNFVVGALEVPIVGIGDTVTWTYDVTNPGPTTLVNLMVDDDQPGVTVTCPKNFLAPGETIRCMATGIGLDLAETGGVPGCNAQGAGNPVPTYENVVNVVATVEGTNVEVTASDPSHYCNPPEVMVEKFTNGHDGDAAGGIPAAGTGDFTVGGSTVAEIPEDGAITWTYTVTNTGTEDLVAVVVTDSKGVFVDCPQSTLAMGETIICTATGFADDLFATGGDVDGCDAQGQGEPRPTYENLATVVASGETSGFEVTDDDPSHYCNPALPPPCGLTVGKGCELPPPPAPPEGKCDGKLQQFTMVWTGGPVTVSGPANDAPGGQVGNGDEVTFFGPFSDNDVIVGLSGAQNGESKFHVSCSDKDMDGDTTTNEDQQQVSSFGRDCGKFQGDGKGSTGINDWLLEGFVDKSGGVLDCNTDVGEVPASVCEFNAIPVSCDTVGKPSNLTFVYTGGGCPGDNSQGSKSDCSGSIDPDGAVTVTLDGGTLGSVNPGESFIVPTTGSNTTIELSNSGGTQTNDVHTSCSAPLVTDDVFGGLTLVGLDGQGLGTDVTYSYRVSNDGPVEVTDILVTDDQLGDIGTIASLQPGDSQTLTAVAFISETTTNVATVDGNGAPGAVCEANSSPVTVEVLPPPPCDVGIAFEKLEDDKVKWKLTNNSVFGKATLQTFTLDFPSGFDFIKKVKLDGDIYKDDDSDTLPDGVGSGVTIGSDDWTKDDVTKRELEQGETRTLEIEFEEKDQSASPSDFDLFLTFEEGCVVGF